MDENLQACKPLVTSTHWSALEKLLNTYIEAETAALLSATDIGTIRESQGKVKAYKRILNLKTTLASLSK